MFLPCAGTSIVMGVEFAAGGRALWVNAAADVVANVAGEGNAAWFSGVCTNHSP